MPNLLAYLVKGAMRYSRQWGSCQQLTQAEVHPRGDGDVEALHVKVLFLKNPVGVIPEGHF